MPEFLVGTRLGIASESVVVYITGSIYYFPSITDMCLLFFLSSCCSFKHPLSQPMGGYILLPILIPVPLVSGSWGWGAVSQCLCGAQLLVAGPKP